MILQLIASSCLPFDNLLFGELRLIEYIERQTGHLLRMLIDLVFVKLLFYNESFLVEGGLDLEKRVHSRFRKEIT